jgi:hypothetical protein
MSRKTLWACLAVVLVAAETQAQTYTIKLKPHPDEGKRSVHSSLERINGQSKLVGPDGKATNQEKINIIKEEVFTESVIEKGDKRPKKFKRAYTKAIGKDGKPASYEGRTVVFEWKGARYQVSVEGKEDLPEKNLADLARKAQREREDDLSQFFSPDKPVKVGDTWPLDKVRLAEVFGQGAELAKDQSRAEATLLRVSKKGDNQFGVIGLDIKLAFKSFEGLKFDEPLTFTVKGTLDTAIDGSSTAAKMSLTGMLKGKAQFEQGGMKFTVELSNNMSLKVENSEEK